MLFMVIETFRNHDLKAIYQRLRERGRSMPEGLNYINSWVDASGGKCFQLMETDNIVLVEWQDLVDFEVVPVAQGKETGAAINALLDQEQTAKSIQ
jgi:hypothetical protein